MNYSGHVLLILLIAYVRNSSPAGDSAPWLGIQRPVPRRSFSYFSSTRRTRNSEVPTFSTVCSCASIKSGSPC